ncbi:MAG: alkanesulfonate monooxygenase, partial [SAR324 cluster bacterium]|nr:alkanesulfonate monooxygenase [SAR324 cluster bacterium]
MFNSQTVVPIQSADLDRVEVAWFAPLCSDDYRYLGVPDGQLRSNWQNTSEVLLTAEKLGF